MTEHSDGASEVALVIKQLLARAGEGGTRAQPRAQDDSPEEGPAVHSGVLAWRIPQREQGRKGSDLTEATVHACRQ